MAFLHVQSDFQPVVTKLSPVNEHIYQRAAVVDVVGVSLCKPFKEIFYIAIFKLRTLDFFLGKLGASSAFSFIVLVEVIDTQRGELPFGIVALIFGASLTVTALSGTVLYKCLLLHAQILVYVDPPLR